MFSYSLIWSYKKYHSLTTILAFKGVKLAKQMVH